jgi:hypothetical protein
MNGRAAIVRFISLALCLLVVFSCSKEERAEESATTEDPAQKAQTLSYISEEVSFGVFFDEEGTKRTLELKRNQKEFNAYIILNFPTDIEIAAVEWRLELPEGVTVINDKYIMERNIAMGHMDHGLSERFPCISGPSLVLHTLTLHTEGELENAEIAILPSKDGQFLGAAECVEGFPRIRATSFRGIVNPAE